MGRTKRQAVLPTEPPVDFVVVTALPEERDALLAKLAGAQKLDKGVRDIHTFHAVRIRTRRKDKSEYTVIVTCLVKMGPITATAQTVSVVTRWRPRYVLLVGIACGIRGAVNHGDLLIATQVADYTIGKQEGGSRKINWDVYPSGVSLLDSANDLGDAWRKGISVSRPGPGEAAREKGVVASGGDVIQDDEIVATYSKSWPKLIGIEMESGGVAAGVHQTPDRPEFLMIKGVSDYGKDKHDPGVIPWRKYACHTAAAFAVALMKSGPSPSQAITKSGDGADREAEEKRREGERQWEYLLSHPFRTLDWFLLLRADVGRSMFDRILHETTLTLDRSTIVRLGSLVATPAPPPEPETERRRHPEYGFRFWETYPGEGGYWVSRRSPGEPKHAGLVAGVSGTVPWSALGVEGLETLADLSRFAEVGVSVPSFAYQVGVEEYELIFGADTFSFHIRLSEEGLLPFLHEMSWMHHEVRGEKEGPDGDVVHLGTTFAGGQLLDKFFKQWMQRWQRSRGSHAPFKGRVGRSGPDGRDIYFYPNEPKSFRGSAEERAYVFTIPGGTHEAFVARVAELEKEVGSSGAPEQSFVQLAAHYGAQGRLLDGLDVLRRAEKAGRAGRDVQRVWGLILTRMDRHPEAVERYERAVSIDPKCAASRNGLAIALAGAGRKRDAVREFRMAVELEPTNPDFQRNLAFALVEANEEIPEAISLLEKFTTATPDDAAALTALGVLLEHVGRDEEAGRCLEGATKLAGGGAPAFVQLGLYHARAGDHVGAIAAFERGLELKKEAHTYALLGSSLAELDRMKDAEKALRAAYRIDPVHHASVASLGAVLAKRGALDEALLLLKRAVELDPADQHSQQNLRTVLEALGGSGSQGPE